MFDLLIN